MNAHQRRNEPRVGSYYAECCLLDLYQIKDENDLAEVIERIACIEECGPLMLFDTLDEAIQSLRGEYDEETEAREFARLGWDQSSKAR